MRTRSRICACIRPRRRLDLLLAAALTLAGPAAAQPSAPSTETCVDVQVGTERSYGCINDRLARIARMAHAPPATDTLSATSPAPAIGSFNRAATAERMGNALGHSVIAQRPPPPIYINPLLTRPPR